MNKLGMSMIKPQLTTIW